jgi:hypothetical protein
MPTAARAAAGVPCMAAATGGAGTLAGMNTPDPATAYAVELLAGYLDGDTPAPPPAEVAVVATATLWMVRRAAGALRSSGRQEELLGAAWVLTHTEMTRDGIPDPPTAPNGRPGPSATAEYLAAQEACGCHDDVDRVLAEFLTGDLAGGTAVLARFTAHVLRLLDGEGAHALLRATLATG